MIRRISCKLLLREKEKRESMQCYLEQWHRNCVSWWWVESKAPRKNTKTFWNKARQGSVFTVLTEKSSVTHGIKQKIAGTIKSLDPPCTGKPSGNSKHPLTCDNYHKQEHYLVDLFNKRSDAKLKNTAGASRIGERGFRHDYAKKTEVKLHSLSHENKNTSRAVSALKKREMSVQSWEEMLHESSWIPGETYSWPSHIAQARRCTCDGFCVASEQEAGEHVTCRLADGNLERIRRLFANL